MQKEIHCKERISYKQVLGIIILHLVIMGIYVGVTCYRFVAAEKLNPIGIGLQQWVLFFAHFYITLIIAGLALKKSAKCIFIHLGAIVTLWILMLLLSHPLWEWLWKLRE